MQADEQQLMDALTRFGKMFSKAAVTVEGIIADVDEAAFTCTVDVARNSWGESVDNYYYNVPLKILRGSQASLIEIPAVNSICLLCFKDNNIQRPQLLSVDQADKVLIKVSDKTLTIVNNTPSFIFNGGTHGNMVLIDALVERLNNIEQDINYLKRVFSVWVPAPSDGGLALKTASGSWAGNTLTKTMNDDIKNEEISQ